MRVDALTAPLHKASTPITNDDAPTTAAWPLARIKLQGSAGAKPLLLLADDPLALGYSCLLWLLHQAAGAALACASMPPFVAVRVFLVRNTIGTDAARITAAATRYSMILLLNAEAWSRWSRELGVSGLLSGALFQRVRALDKASTTLTVINPATLVILAFDYTRVKSFDVPGTAAGRAFGRRCQQNYVPSVLAGAPTNVRNTVGTDEASITVAATRSSIKWFNEATWSRSFSNLVASGLLNGAPFRRVRDSDMAFTALTVFNYAALAVSKDRQPTSLELGLAKARSDCVNGDGAASSSGQSQFESPPNSPVSSSYSPLPSPSVEEEPQSEQNVPGLPAAAVSEAPSAAESGVSSSSNVVDNSPQTEW